MLLPSQQTRRLTAIALASSYGVIVTITRW